MSREILHTLPVNVQANWVGTLFLRVNDRSIDSIAVTFPSLFDTENRITTVKIGFIGAGQMARALAQGFVDSQIVATEQLAISDPSPAAMDAFQALLPECQRRDSNLALVQDREVVILAVKPQSLEAVFQELTQHDSAGKLWISIVAGATCEQLSNGLGTDRIVRVMPNTPALVGCGASAFCCGGGATDADGALASQLLGSVGYVTELPERQLDAVTGLSGSGPAFVFQFIEAMADGGVRAGLTRQVAQELAIHTVYGAAQLALQTETHPAEWKDRVASPAGTTIEGLQALENGGLRGTVMQAVFAAAQRSRELGQS